MKLGELCETSSYLEGSRMNPRATGASISKYLCFYPQRRARRETVNTCCGHLYMQKKGIKGHCALVKDWSSSYTA